MEAKGDGDEFEGAPLPRARRGSWLTRLALPVWVPPSVSLFANLLIRLLGQGDGWIKVSQAGYSAPRAAKNAARGAQPALHRY